jgi:hypothetical protein
MTSTFDSRHISTHFAIAKNGSIWQFVDTDQSARALGGSYRDTKWISVETFALPGDLLTGPQLASVANLYAWLIRTTGMSMNIVDVTKPAAEFDWEKSKASAVTRCSRITLTARSVRARGYWDKDRSSWRWWQGWFFLRERRLPHPIRNTNRGRKFSLAAIAV